ncbi:hypothetical protein DV495_004764 [Geotrichum candidum]|uniref:BAG domain-containing protein n=1 Tax=Geotrichum candidum TaxID=1173061 RepID=A0A0J9XHV3_GEOCN|nr:hypothetical protein DV495_004764 [Geotrichum candidum]KAF7501004.1 hypothetical protein DV113_000976 [Geotrichum candidum]KAI8134923.1 hypothetical protein DUD61_001375 [Geotrichum candidum]KAI9214629.1 hypothetical protein DS838_000429 [Geotrichum bryndzae]CDO56528.1 Hypothetical protein, no similarity [Geotrichum candidum]
MNQLVDTIQGKTGRIIEQLPERVQSLGTPVAVIALGFVTATVIKAVLRRALRLDEFDEVNSGNAAAAATTTPRAGTTVSGKNKIHVVFNDEQYEFALPANLAATTLGEFKQQLAAFLTPMALAARGKAMLGSGDVLPAARFTFTAAPDTSGDRRTPLPADAVEDAKPLAQLPNLVKKGSFMLVDEAAAPAPEAEVDEITRIYEEILEKENQQQQRRKRRNNNKKAKKGGKKSNKNDNGNDDDAEHDFPVSAQKPLTPAEELAAVQAGVDAELVPLVTEFEKTGVKAGAAEREEERHRLSELVLIRMFSLDGIDVSEDQALRAERKAMINAMHALLARIDKVGK